MAVPKEGQQRPPSRKSTALDKLAVSSVVGTSGQLGGRAAPSGGEACPQRVKQLDGRLPSRASSSASGTIPCGIPSSRGFQTEYRRKFGGSRPGTGASSVSSLPGRALSTAPGPSHDRTASALSRVTRTLPHRPGTAQPPPMLRPSTSGVGKSNHLKNEESVGWAPGIANSAAACQPGQESIPQMRRPASSSSLSAVPRTPISRGHISAQQAGTLRPTTAQLLLEQHQSRCQPPHPAIKEETEAAADEAATSEQSTKPGPMLANRSGLVSDSENFAQAPIATPRLPIPPLDRSPPRTPFKQEESTTQQDAPEIDLLHIDVGQHQDDEPCAIGQAAPMVLNLEDLAQSTPEVLELEVENLDIQQIQKLEEKIRKELEAVEASSQASNARAAD